MEKQISTPNILQLAEIKFHGIFRIQTCFLTIKALKIPYRDSFSHMQYSLQNPMPYMFLCRESIPITLQSPLPLEKEIENERSKKIVCTLQIKM